MSFLPYACFTGLTGFFLWLGWSEHRVVEGHALRIFRALESGPDEGQYGLQVGKAAGVRTGLLYPALRWLEDRHYIVGEFEPDRREEIGRPPRRFYRTTEAGRRWLASPTPKETE